MVRDLPLRLSRWPFTLVGGLSLAVLVLAMGGVLESEGLTLVLSLPAYLAHLALLAGEVALGIDVPGWLAGPRLALRLLPFVLVDLAIQGVGALRASAAAD